MEFVRLAKSETNDEGCPQQREEEEEDQDKSEHAGIKDIRALCRLIVHPSSDPL